MAGEIRIDVKPKKLRFEAWIGERLVCTSRTPFFDTARVLIAEGEAPQTQIVMVWPNGTVGLRAPVGQAAKLAVWETNWGPRIVLYEEFENNALAKDPQEDLGPSKC